jgi:tRNA(adenine34) deaminase
MCAGAIVQARIPKVVIGCQSQKSGCGGTILNILENPDFNHQCEVVWNVMEEDCSSILKKFFLELRIRNKLEKKARKELE